jgi:hypothetical protein
MLNMDIIDGVPRSRKTRLYNIYLIPMIIRIIEIFYFLCLVYVYVTGKYSKCYSNMEDVRVVKGCGAVYNEG